MLSNEFRNYLKSLTQDGLKSSDSSNAQAHPVSTPPLTPSYPLNPSYAPPPLTSQPNVMSQMMGQPSVYPQPAAYVQMPSPMPPPPVSYWGGGYSPVGYWGVPPQPPPQYVYAPSGSV
eukprot:GHVR01156873.1.p1 GENE.GHVR01156873.1~~GHVR01156873.1.p1  ORF type:complete len:118 (+),score=35.44 GHVR01156873.1:157-510(+)